MTPEQLRVIIVVYLSAIVPLIIMWAMHRKKKLPEWVPTLYFWAFIACAAGWELWFSYGLIAGDPVDLRRAHELSQAIPFHLNWLLNSLADAGAICLGGLLLVWLCLKRDDAFMHRWHWSAFFLFLVIFIAQNVFVEMFLYHDQLAIGKALSWAPFAPTGSWYNPTLFQFDTRTVSLQGQLPWLIMTPVFYWMLIKIRKLYP